MSESHFTEAVNGHRYILTLMYGVVAGLLYGLFAAYVGAVTWDTDDYSSAAAAKQRKAAEAAAAAAAGGAAAAAAVAARPNPKEWYDQHHAKYKESAFTTGATARAFTSTVAVATTKSERQLQRVERNPSKKGA